MHLRRGPSKNAVGPFGGLTEVTRPSAGHADAADVRTVARPMIRAGLFPHCFFLRGLFVPRRLCAGLDDDPHARPETHSNPVRVHHVERDTDKAEFFSLRFTERRFTMAQPYPVSPCDGQQRTPYSHVPLIWATPFPKESSRMSVVPNNETKMHVFTASSSPKLFAHLSEAVLNGIHINETSAVPANPVLRECVP